MAKSSEVKEAEVSKNPAYDVGHELTYDDDVTGIPVDEMSDLEAISFAERMEAGDQIADYDEVHPRHDNTGPEHDLQAREDARAEEIAKQAKKARAALKAMDGFR